MALKSYENSDILGQLLIHKAAADSQKADLSSQRKPSHIMYNESDVMRLDYGSLICSVNGEWNRVAGVAVACLQKGFVVIKKSHPDILL